MEIKKPRIVDKVWGYEEIIVNLDGKYCGKKLHLNKGYRCSIHRHTKEETFYIEKGKIYLELENENKEIEGEVLCECNIVHILPNRWHRFSGLEDSIIIEFSTPDTESERRELSGKIPDFEEFLKNIKI